MLSELKVIKGVIKLLNDSKVHMYVHILSIYTQYALLVYYVYNDYAGIPILASRRLEIGLCSVHRNDAEIIASSVNEYSSKNYKYSNYDV